MRNARQKRGDWGEEVAARYLGGKGLRVIDRNVRSPFGEIDIVCENNKELVFVEVKTRNSTLYGYPEESVNATKQRKLRQLAQWYWNSHPRYGTIRIDVVAILIQSSGLFQVEHFVAAV